MKDYKKRELCLIIPSNLLFIGLLLFLIIYYSIVINDNVNQLNDLNIIFVEDDYDNCNYQLVNINFNNNTCIGNIYNINKNISCQINMNYNDDSDLILEYCFNKNNYQCHKYSPDVKNNNICFTSYHYLNLIYDNINSVEKQNIIQFTIFVLLVLLLAICPLSYWCWWLLVVDKN